MPYRKRASLQASERYGIKNENFFCYTGLAGVSSETSTAILNASPQNSPGEVKSPSATGKNSCNVVVYYYYCYHHYYYCCFALH